MQINFTHEGGIYVAELTANNSAAVQMERAEPGYVRILRRMDNSDGWTIYRVWGRQTARESFFADLDSSAYPCQWRIESEMAVSSCKVNISSGTGSSAELESIKERLDALDGMAEDTTDTIDTMAEMKAYLAGIKNDQTISDTVKDGIDANTMSDEKYQEIKNLIK